MQSQLQRKQTVLAESELKLSQSKTALEELMIRKQAVSAGMRQAEDGHVTTVAEQLMQAQSQAATLETGEPALPTSRAALHVALFALLAAAEIRGCQMRIADTQSIIATVTKEIKAHAKDCKALQAEHAASVKALEKLTVSVRCVVALCARVASCIWGLSV